MRRIASRCAWYALAALYVLVYLQHRRTLGIIEERDRYQQNSSALLSEVKRYRVDSVTMAMDVKALHLSVDEFERYRAEDLAKIKAMGLKIRNLKAAAKQEPEVKVPLDAVVRDTIVIRDTLPAIVQSVEMNTPKIRMRGVTEDGRLKGTIIVPVTLRQAIWIKYKRRWIFWKRVKAVHQTITCDNPFAEIKYSEYTQIER